MAFPSKTTVDTDFTALADLLTPGTYTPSELKAVFHNNWNGILVYLNAIKTVLESTTDADSGADNIGATAITDLTGATVQAILENLRNTLKSIVDASSGADFVNSTAITGVTGTTVQSQLESIKSLIDLIYTKAQLDAGQLDTRYYTKTELNAGQLDTRYYTETEIQSITDGTSGADKTGATEVATGSGTTVQTILEWLYAELVSVVLGQIPNDSLTNVKLGTDIKVGSLASLTTTDKTSVVAAFNEHVAANVTEFQLTRIRSYMEV